MTTFMRSMYFMAFTAALFVDVHAQTTGQYYAAVRMPYGPGQWYNDYIPVTITVATVNATNCRGDLYVKKRVVTPPSWPVTINNKQYVEADAIRYWDWVYEGYQGGGALDWETNCHGYAFGVGDWPDNSQTIIGGTPPCWVEDLSEQTTIADADFGHTVKVVIKDCKNSHGLIVLRSDEQFRESATYTQQGSCDLQNGGTIDLSKGNGPRSGMMFKFYKQNN
ncbi:MAG: hypothetical protein KatS3mg111_3459 [Pirellulaceae bacterium]|nr:MAG: hypothetical protein KatS3mg111_3459 [Pirellulaceae bacterium]